MKHFLGSVMVRGSVRGLFYNIPVETKSNHSSMVSHSNGSQIRLVRKLVLPNGRINRPNVSPKCSPDQGFL